MDRLAPSVEGLPYDLQLPVERLEFEIYLCDLRHDRKLECLLGLYGLEVFGQSGFVFPSQVSPEVYLPADGEFASDFRIVTLVFALVVEVLPIGVHIYADGGKHVGEPDSFGGSQLLDPFCSDQQVLVVFQRPCDQSLKDRIGVERTPADIGHVIRIGDDTFEGIRKLHLRNRMDPAYTACLHRQQQNPYYRQTKQVAIS